MLQKIKKLFIYPFLDIYILLKSNRTESIISIWFISCVLIMLTIYFSNDYNLNLNLVGDAMWWIFGTLISTIVLVFVVESYKLQKKELEDTRKVLKWQEDTMREQRVQSLVIELLSLSQRHLDSFISKNDITQYLRTSTAEKISKDLLEWELNSIINHFRTLKYIESIIENEYKNDDLKMKQYLYLIESQINDNIRVLYNSIIGLKEWVDKELITFNYLFKVKPHKYWEIGDILFF